MSKNLFGYGIDDSPAVAPAAPVTDAPQGHADSAGEFVRGWAALAAIVGAVACLTPLWAVGLGMALVGLWFAGGTYAVEPVAAAARAETQATGSGCAYWLLAGIMVALVGLAACVLIASFAQGVMR